MAAFITALSCQGASGEAANQSSLRPSDSFTSRRVTGAMPGVDEIPGQELRPSMSESRRPASPSASKMASSVRFSALRPARRPAMARPTPVIAARRSRISVTSLARGLGRVADELERALRARAHAPLRQGFQLLRHALLIETDVAVRVELEELRDRRAARVPGNCLRSATIFIGFPCLELRFRKANDHPIDIGRDRDLAGKPAVGLQLEQAFQHRALRAAGRRNLREPGGVNESVTGAGSCRLPLQSATIPGTQFSTAACMTERPVSACTSRFSPLCSMKMIVGMNGGSLEDILLTVAHDR